MITFWPDLINNKVYQKEKEKKEKRNSEGKSEHALSGYIFLYCLLCASSLSLP